MNKLSSLFINIELFPLFYSTGGLLKHSCASTEDYYPHPSQVCLKVHGQLAKWLSDIYYHIIRQTAISNQDKRGPLKEGNGIQMKTEGVPQVCSKNC